jgi:hypothetical protein
MKKIRIDDRVLNPNFLIISIFHYEKLCLPKSHYPTARVQKSTCIQILCSYPLDTTTIMQLSPLKYMELINKLLR